MSAQGPPTPAQERVLYASNFDRDAPVVDLPPVKTANGKASKNGTATGATPVKPADPPATQRARYRYEPYRRAGPTPGREGNLPADPEDLETLDVTSKEIYKSDHEILEYIEALNHRTAAVLEHVNRNSSQLHSCKGVMEKIQQFVDQWRNTGGQWTSQQSVGDSNLGAEWESGKMKILASEESSGEDDDAPNPGPSATVARGKNGVSSTAEGSEYVRLGSLAHSQFRNFTLDKAGAGAVPSPRPEPPHLGVTHPTPHITSPSHTTLGLKRKRSSAPENGGRGGDVETTAGPSNAFAQPNGNVPPQAEARDDESRVSKKRRRITRQPSWDLQMFIEAGYVPDPPYADPPKNDSSEPSPQPGYRKSSSPVICASQIQEDDSETERSTVIELLSRVVEQGGSEDEDEPEGNVLDGLGESQHPLPPLTTDNTQAGFTENTQSSLETPGGSQVPTKAFQKDTNVAIFIPGPELESANISSKSTRFSLNGSPEKKECKVFRKTPFRPRVSSRTAQAENGLTAKAEAESQDELVLQLPAPKKKRAVGARTRKQKAAPSVEPRPDNSGSPKPPSKLRRGRSQPEVPAVPKPPVKRSTRSRK